MSSRERGRGFLVAVVCLVISVLVVACLALAAFSSKGKDPDQKTHLRISSTYAAESGLLMAEDKLLSLKEAPPVGIWIEGELPNAKSTYAVEVLEEGRSSTRFLLRSKGVTKQESSEPQVTTINSEMNYLDGKWVSLKRSLE